MVQLITFTSEAIESLTRHANNANIPKWLNNKFPLHYTREESVRFIQYAQTFSPPEILAITYNGEVVGAIGLHPQKDIHIKNIELGYWIGEEHWGKGIATRAVGLGMAHARRHWDFNRMVSRVFGNNEASKRVLIKNGFVEEAVFRGAIYKYGTYYDEHFFCWFLPKQT